MIRQPCVSGLFYPSRKDLIEEIIEEKFNDVKDITLDNISQSNTITTAVVPHAGYVYSAGCAAYAFKSIAQETLPDTIIIVGPNHTGLGSKKIALSQHDYWNTPLGDIAVDTEFQKELINENPDCDYDDIAHLREHSLEVEIPFIQYISNIQDKDVKILPITISFQEVNTCINLATSLYNISEKLNRKCLIIASTDLTHYEDANSARSKDTRVLNDIEAMDIEQLVSDINTYQISMCGYGPTITGISYSKLLNANNSIVLDYRNSGDVRKEYDSVVGYGSAIIKK